MVVVWWVVVATLPHSLTILTYDKLASILTCLNDVLAPISPRLGVCTLGWTRLGGSLG